MIKAILFDLDGTLLDTLQDLADSTNAALLAHHYPTRSVEEVRSFVGNGVARLMERALPDGRENPHFEECLAAFKAHYAVHMQDKTAPYQGIMEILALLKEKGYRMGIVSNKFDLAVKELNLQYFNGIISVAIGESEHIHKKPSPDTVFAALKELGCEPLEAVYIGDSEVDIQTAANAGMSCISVTWGFRTREFLQEQGAVHLIDTPEELLCAIESVS